LQYRWLSTDRWLDLDLGLLEACGSRHDVELVLIQAEQGYWAGDLDSYGRTPSWLRRLQAGDAPRRRRRRERSCRHPTADVCEAIPAPDPDWLGNAPTGAAD
jgi:hypothetical protein